MEYIRAFLVGGIICILVQILMDHTTLQPKDHGTLSYCRCYSWGTGDL